MDKKEVINQIKSLLTFSSTDEVIENEVIVKMTEWTLADGTIISSDSEELVIGEAVMVVAEEGSINAPEGEYTLEDGKVIIVDEMGIIVEIKEVEEDITEEVIEDTAPVVEEEMAETEIPAVDAEEGTPAIVGTETPEIDEIAETIQEEINEVIDQNDENVILSNRMNSLEDLVRTLVEKQNNLIDANVAMSKIIEDYGNETTTKDLAVVNKSFSTMKSTKEDSLEAISRMRRGN